MNPFYHHNFIMFSQEYNFFPKFLKFQFTIAKPFSHFLQSIKADIQTYYRTILIIRLKVLFIL